MILNAYITDELHSGQSDRNAALATQLRYMASRINKAADRAKDGDFASLHPHEIEMVALQDAVLAYLSANQNRIGNISLAWGLINLVRAGSVAHKPREES